MMTLSKNTIEILKNFYSINQGMLFKEGNVLRTVNVTNSILVEATVQDSFPRDFAVYNLMTLLGTFSLFQGDINIDFDDKFLTLKGKERNLVYVYSSPSVIVSPGDKVPSLPSVDMSFDLTSDDLSSIQKCSGLLLLEDIRITNVGVQVLNVNRNGEGDYSNIFTIEKDVKCTNDDAEAFIKIENLKLLPLSYRVDVCTRGIASFTSLDDDYKVTYYIALMVNKK